MPIILSDAETLVEFTCRGVIPVWRLKTVETFANITKHNQRYGRAATAEEIAEIRKHAGDAAKAIAGTRKEAEK